jgi:hypothetical protein
VVASLIVNCEIAFLIFPSHFREIDPKIIMDYIITTPFRSMDDRESGMGHGYEPTDLILDTKTTAAFVAPTDASTSTGRSSLDDYDDYDPSYAVYERELDGNSGSQEADGFVSTNKSTRTGVSVRRRVSDSFRSLKENFKRMAKRKHLDSTWTQ